CEIQQSSNCTYRLYDFKRKDKFGDYRELHIDKALDVLNFSKYCPEKIDEGIVDGDGFKKRIISQCKYFECTLIDVDLSARILGVEESFTSFLVLEGEGRISVRSIDDPEKVKEGIAFKAGDSFFAPKSTDIFMIEGKSRLIMTRV
ncbi:MAG: mannose-1-phosphate guanylyltransferase, partial [Lachnospiraceae bacterium]|nr:mannose-1-phosphate guanylyltransferase [Lachnospiraceae bacterium]